MFGDAPSNANTRSQPARSEYSKKRSRARASTWGGSIHRENYLHSAGMLLMNGAFGHTTPPPIRRDARQAVRGAYGGWPSAGSQEASWTAQAAIPLRLWCAAMSLALALILFVASLVIAASGWLGARIGGTS